MAFRIMRVSDRAGFGSCLSGGWFIHGQQPEHRAMRPRRRDHVMKLSVLLVAISMAGDPALAQTGASLVDGDWVGKGSFQLGPSILSCSEIKMKFVGTPDLYGVRDGSVVCETLKRAFPMNDDFEVRSNNDVYYKGRKVGSIVDDRLVVLVPGQDDIGT